MKDMFFIVKIISGKNYFLHSDGKFYWNFHSYGKLRPLCYKNKGFAVRRAENCKDVFVLNSKEIPEL